MKTLFLNPETWDLSIDNQRNIAAASEPYAQAQDAASEIKTFQGECWYDKKKGVPHHERILGRRPPPSLMKHYFNQAALLTPSVVAATTYLSAFDNRDQSGQVQIKNDAGQTSTANF